MRLYHALHPFVVRSSQFVFHTLAAVRRGFRAAAGGPRELQTAPRYFPDLQEILIPEKTPNVRIFDVEYTGTPSETYTYAIIQNPGNFVRICFFVACSSAGVPRILGPSPPGPCGVLTLGFFVACCCPAAVHPRGNRRVRGTWCHLRLLHSNAALRTQRFPVAVARRVKTLYVVCCLCLQLIIVRATNTLDTSLTATLTLSVTIQGPHAFHFPWRGHLHSH